MPRTPAPPKSGPPRRSYYARRSNAPLMAVGVAVLVALVVLRLVLALVPNPDWQVFSAVIPSTARDLFFAKDFPVA